MVPSNEIAQWIVHTVGFQPDYWSIGNEPTGWTHYGIPWTKWSASDASTPTPLAYALDVKAAIAAVSAVDPGAKFIGVEAACPCNSAWFQQVAKIDGDRIAAIAYHSYPSTGATTVSLPQFYGPLATSSNLSGSYALVRSQIAGQCATCASLPIFVNEYNAGPGWAPSNLGGSYANAVFLAASVVQALNANVSQLTIFNLQNGAPSYGFSMMTSKGVVGPTGILFSQMLPHLAIGTTYGTSIATLVPGLWSVLTRNATTQSLLVVNTNLTQSVSVSLGLAFQVTSPGNVYRWSPGVAVPSVASETPAAEYTVPSEGILLLSFPVASGAVMASATPSSFHEPADGGARHLAATGSSATLLLGAIVLIATSLARRPRPHRSAVRDPDRRARPLSVTKSR